MAIQLKRPAEVEGLREAGRIVAGAFAMLRGQVRPGVSLREPDERVLRAGDIVGIDIGLKYKGWCGDSCVTYAVGIQTPANDRLLAAAEEAMWQGVNAAQAGSHLSDIGAAIQIYAEAQGYSVVYDWGGQRIGQSPPQNPHQSHHGPGGQGAA